MKADESWSTWLPQPTPVGSEAELGQSDRIVIVRGIVPDHGQAKRIEPNARPRPVHPGDSKAEKVAGGNIRRHEVSSRIVPRALILLAGSGRERRTGPGGTRRRPLEPAAHSIAGKRLQATIVVASNAGRMRQTTPRVKLSRPTGAATSDSGSRALPMKKSVKSAVPSACNQPGARPRVCAQVSVSKAMTVYQATHR